MSSNSSSYKVGLNISIKSFITAIVVIFVLMVASYVLTLFVPSGAYERVVNAEGNLAWTCRRHLRRLGKALLEIPGGKPRPHLAPSYLRSRGGV